MQEEDWIYTSDRLIFIFGIKLKKIFVDNNFLDFVNKKNIFIENDN